MTTVAEIMGGKIYDQAARSTMTIGDREIPIQEMLDQRDKPTIHAEGRIVEIDLGILPISVTRDKDSVVAKFVGDHGKYIYIYDYRKEAIAAYDLMEMDGYLGFYRDLVPCLGTLRKGKGMYIALADIGSPECDIEDGGANQELFLYRTPAMDHALFRVVASGDLVALHPATKICIAEGKI